MINRAIHQLVVHEHGEAAWERVRVRAGVSAAPFLSMETYDDAVTYDLVAAASAELGAPASAILKRFGAWWVHTTASEGYGPLFDQAGGSLPEFLLSLDDLHARIALHLPSLRPPSFRCTEIGETSLLLHYQSQREGLAPLVIGLVEALGERFGTPATVELVQPRQPGQTTDVFAVRWTPRQE